MKRIGADTIPAFQVVYFRKGLAGTKNPVEQIRFNVQPGLLPPFPRSVNCRISSWIAGKDAFKPGEAKNSWLTGTAAWNYYAITQFILGIKPDYAGLEIDPCIPKEWDCFEITRKFRGSTYRILVRNPEHVNKGVKQIMVDGEEIEGQVVPIMEPDRTYEVEVLMG